MKRALAGAAIVIGFAFISGCVATDAPAGVPRGLSFGVTPIFPNSFDIVVTGPLRQSGDVLRDAWRKKADQTAAGRAFRVSRLTERVSEMSGGGWPVRAQSVSGTITLERTGNQPTQ